MAYATKYLLGTIPLSRIGNLIEIYVWIQEKDYVGSVENLKATFDSYKINRDFTNLETYVLGMNFEMSIRNEKSNFYELLPLMTATEKKYKVIAQLFVNKQQKERIFEGFLNTETNKQKMLHFQSIKLVASSFLSKSKDYSPSIIDTSQNISFIDVVSNILSSLGSEDNIRVAATLLQPKEDYGVQDATTGNPGESFMNLTGFVTELYWENNVERKKGYDILESIGKTFNCYFYWWDGYWYIEHYKNIWTDTGYKKYVQYDITQSYNPFNMGVWTDQVAIPVTPLHTNLLFYDMTQTIGTIPGYRKVSVKLNEKKLDNMVSPIFSPMVVVTTDDATQIAPLVDYRQWARYHAVAGNMDWGDVDVPYKDIANAIKQTYIDPQLEGNTSEARKGLYTKFKITINDKTQFSINWKYNPGDAWDTVYTDVAFFRQYYSVLLINTAGEYMNVAYDELKGKWIYYPNYYFLVNTISVKQDSFDQDTHTGTFSASIPLGSLVDDFDVPLPDGDYTVVFTIGRIYRYALSFPVLTPVSPGWFGDIEVAASGNDLPDNYIEGDTNTDFVSTKELNVDLADISDWTFLNGILRGGTAEEPFLEKTTEWGNPADNPEPIMDLLLRDKVRIYNVIRQEITGNVISPDVMLRPLSLFVDENQSNLKFVLMGMSHKLNTGAYSLDLMEYDNETEVTFTES